MIPVPSVETMLLVIGLTLAAITLVIGGLGALFNHSEAERHRAQPDVGGTPARRGPATAPTAPSTTRDRETVGV